MSATQRATQRELAFAVEQFGHTGGTFGQPAGVGQALVAGLQFGQLGRRQCPLFQLPGFVPQEFQALLVVTAAAEPAHARTQFPPTRGSIPHLGQEDLVAGVGIQQRQLVCP